MLTESMLLGAAGGIVGALFSVGVSALVAHFALQDATAILVASNVQYLLLGIGFGIGTSLLSGLYPAWKAANEHPVDALRS
jgi:putative ABC transport system permease protein